LPNWNYATASAPALFSSDGALVARSVGIWIGIGVAIAIVVIAVIVVIFLRYRLAAEEIDVSEAPRSIATEFSLMTYTNNLDLTFADGTGVDSLYLDAVEE
jgi:hypothetical protein